MALFFPSPPEAQQNGKIFVPGDYTTSDVIVPATVGGIILIPAGTEGSARFIGLSVASAGTIFIKFGGDPTTTDYALKMFGTFTRGDQFLDHLIGDQEWKAISQTGTVTVKVSIAATVAIDVA
jgi:hypothetical protein